MPDSFVEGVEQEFESPRKQKAVKQLFNNYKHHQNSSKGSPQSLRKYVIDEVKKLQRNEVPIANLLDQLHKKKSENSMKGRTMKRPQQNAVPPPPKPLNLVE